MPVERVVGRRAGDDDQVVGLIGVRAPHLLSGDDPLVAVALGAGADRRDVGSGVRFAERERAEVLAARDTRQDRLALGGAETGDQAVATGDDARHAHPRPGQLLGHDAVLDEPEAETPVLLRHENAEQPHLRHRAHDVLGDEPVLRIELVGDGQHHVHREAPDGIAHRQPLVGQVGGRQGNRRGWKERHRNTLSFACHLLVN